VRRIGFSSRASFHVAKDDLAMVDFRPNGQRRRSTAVRRSRFSEAQVVANLREFDAGMPPRNSHDARTHANMIRLWRAPYTTCCGARWYATRQL